MPSARKEGGVAAAIAVWHLCAYAFSLGFMQPPASIGSYTVVASDLIFVALAMLFALRVATKRVRLVTDRAYLFIGFYLAAMAASVLVSADIAAGAAKLATQLYLLALPVLLCCLVSSEAMLRRVVQAWLAGTAVVALVGMVSLALFAFEPNHPLLTITRYHFGTLPPGDYPRLQLTFLNANLACNYLVTSLSLLLAASHREWIVRKLAQFLGVGILISAAATLSPGLGGMALLIGLWWWMLKRVEQPRLARSLLWAGIAAAFLFVVATSVTPFLFPTAPFLIHLPIAGLVLAGSPRLVIWMQATANFLEHPVFGRGLGSDAVAVHYLDPSGHRQFLTDAHNMFLNIAVQCGVLGLAALVALVAHMALRTGPLKLTGNAAATVRVAAGLGLLNGLVYQGLGGSFEDARHLWFLFGLLLASSRLASAGHTRIGIST